MSDDDDDFRTLCLHLAAEWYVCDREQERSNKNHYILVTIGSVLFSELLVMIVCTFYVKRCFRAEVRFLFLARILI